MRLIDADALIDDCKKYLNTLNPSRDGKECTKIHWLIGVLNNVTSTQPEPQWIPCSERLPSEDAYYLVTLGTANCLKDGRDVEIAPLTDGHWDWWNDLVIAWMPLPMPWKGEQNE